MQQHLKLLLIFSTLCALSPGAAKSPQTEAYLPSPYSWPEVVALQEEIFSYTPVSGSVVRGVMYSSDEPDERSGLILLPDGLTSEQTLCFQIDARDGSYIGRGSLAGSLDAVSQIQLSLDGKEFRRLVRDNDAASLIAWVEAEKSCSDAATRKIVPTSWSSANPPVSLRFLINSTGLHARIALRAADTLMYSTHDCAILDETGENRVYDSSCNVPLCQLANSDRILVEIRNRNQRIHLEELPLSSVGAYCMATK